MSEVHQGISCLRLLRSSDLNDVNGVRIRIYRQDERDLLSLMALQRVRVTHFVFLAVRIIGKGLAVLADGACHFLALVLALASGTASVGLTLVTRLCLGLTG